MPGFHTLKQEGYPLTATEVAVIESIAALSDPGADRIMFWDESEDAFAWLTVGAGLTITDTTISASAATPTVITVANEATDETCFPAFFTAATGDLGPKTNAGLTFNSSTAVLSATGLAGAFNGSIGATTPSTMVGTTITANTGIVPDANDGAYLGQSGTAFSDLFLASGGVIDWLAGAVTITHSANTLTFGGSAFTTLALGATNITMTGSLAETGNRITKGWFTDLEITNLPTINGGTLATALSLGTMASETATNYVAKSLYDAHSVLYATSDNTPAALTVTEQSVVGRLTGGNISAVAIGIADNNIVQIDSADAADNDFAKFTANGLEGRSYSETLGDIGALGTAGGTMSGNITLGENTSIALDPAGSADGKYTGITVIGTAGATVAFGDLITLDKDDSRWELVDISAAAAATGDARGILGMAVSAGNDGDAITILLHGIIRADANFPALTIGAAVYASTTGDIVVAQPSTTDYVIRIVGYALTADEIYFNPENDWITHIA
jgi:hypothetical protein